jgi:chromosome segregation ATPase
MNDESWRSRVKLFGKDSLNSVDRWRMEMDELGQDRAKAKAQMRREQERRECDVAQASAREEIAELKQRLAAVEQQVASFDELAQAVATFGAAVDNKLVELQRLLTRHAELRQAESPQPKGFQGFAREKGDTEVLDLPDFIRKMH